MATKRPKMNKVYHGDCHTILKTLPDECVDLIVTSPPYADRRNHTYGGIHPDHYVQWFIPISLELQRVLKPKGSLILNIKEQVINGERGTYVLELIIAMRMFGWFWIEDYCWHKKNAFPGKWPNRFRDAWEHCLHFTKEKKFAMFQKAVRVPIGKWAEKRLKKLGKQDRVRNESRSKSGFGRKVANWTGRSLVYPTNVLHFSTEVKNRNHSAVFPEELPSFFIRLFTREGDVVLDPFLGSGTTAVVAKKLNRNYIGIEKRLKYVRLAEKRLAPHQRK